ncbi:TBATA protein, partial [Polypterus senegalus]|nr:TBATA protein [Polypterus senegalus]
MPAGEELQQETSSRKFCCQGAALNDGGLETNVRHPHWCVNDAPVCSVNDDCLFLTMPCHLEKSGLARSYLMMMSPSTALGSEYACCSWKPAMASGPAAVTATGLPVLHVGLQLWREELRNLTARAGLGTAAEKRKVTLLEQGGQQLAGRVTSTGRLREDQRRRSEELLVLDLLCQILHTDSLTAVQTWLLTASDTEKDKVLSLIHRVTSGCQPEVQPTQSEEQKLPAIAVPCTSSDLPTTPVKSQKKDLQSRTEKAERLEPSNLFLKKITSEFTRVLLISLSGPDVILKYRVADSGEIHHCKGSFPPVRAP